MSRGPSLLLAVLAAAWLACGGGESADASLEDDAVRVRVEGLALDEDAGSPIVILVEVEGERRLPIWIGLAEAHSIASQLEARTPPRPNTHDLATRLIKGLDGSVRHVVVTDLRDGIYYARIDLERDGRRIPIDARPSDAIAIGLRLGAPLFVRSGLFEREGLGTDEPGQPIRGTPRERQERARRL